MAFVRVCAEVLTYGNHLWMFDAMTGKGIRPPSGRHDQYAVKLEDGKVFVDPEASPPAAVS